MECLLCSLKFTKVKFIKKHYVNYHAVNEDDPHFVELFKPDTVERKCRICCVKFDSARLKKKHMFLYHYGQQMGGSRNLRASDLPLNILKKGSITYYSVNFDQHKNFYDFYSSDIVDVFLDSVYQVFQPKSSMFKFQGYAEIVNQQRGETVVLENKRVWLTNVYQFKYFNEFVRGEIKDEIIKRVIVNGQSGSSWYFKRFNRLNIIVVPSSDAKKLITS